MDIDSMLTKFFQALEVVDPTNYLDDNEQADATTLPRATEMSDVAAPSPAASASTTPAPTPEPTNVVNAPSAPSVSAAATPADSEPTQNCPICLDDVPLSAILVPGPCNHGFCRDCLTMQATLAARAARAPLPCASCGASLDATSVLPLLTPADATALTNALAVAAAGFVRYCAYCNEAVSGGLPTFTCPRCGKQNGPREDDTLAALAASKGWTACPGCGHLASKDSSWSCNYAMCICGVSFCLRCGAPYIRAGGSSSNPRPSNQHGTPSCDCGLYEK